MKLVVQIPCFNEARQLPSMLSELPREVDGFDIVEWLVIDDGSSDGSTEDLRSYAARDPRVRLSVQKNSGLTKALNVGLKLSRGEFIARMDADDVARPERFAKQVGAFLSNPKLVILGAHKQAMVTRTSVVILPTFKPCFGVALGLINGL